MFKFIKSIFDEETMGEEIVKANERTYAGAKKMYPDKSKLDWLSVTYIARLRARLIFSESSKIDAQYYCSALANVPEPLNARALGLIILHLERRDIVQNYPKFSRELEEIIAKYGVEL